MNLHTYPDYPSLSRATANRIARYITEKPDALVCLASGNTPIRLFSYLVDDVRAGQLDLDHCTFVALDEWIGIEPTIEGSCRNMMDRDFFKPLGIKEDSIRFFDGMAADPNLECTAINDLIARHEGLDIMLVGIGLNGHIAMNEPGTPFDSYAHVSDLSEETKIVGQKYFSRTTPLTRGLTLGLRHLAESKLPILMANGSKKAAIIKKALTLSPDKAVPASIVQQIAGAEIMLDKEAASLL